MGHGIEASSPMPHYDSHASPKIVDGIQEHEKNSKNWPPFWFLLVISMPRMACNMAWSAQWAALGPYLETMLPSFAVQLTQFIGPITGIIVGPSTGVFSDRCTSKYGRRRPFLVVASLTSIICWTLMGYTRQIGEALGDSGLGTENRKWTTFFTIVFYVWMDITVNVVQTPAMLLIADCSGDRQTTGAALGQGWSTLGNIMIAGYVEFWGPGYQTMHEFMAMLSIVMAVCVGVVCLIVKEEPLDKSKLPEQTTWEGVKEAFLSIYHGLKSLPLVLMWYSITFFFVCYGSSAYSSSKGQFFGYEVYGGDASNADICGDNCTEAQNDYNDGVSMATGRGDLLMNIAGVVFSLVLPFLVRTIGAKWVVCLSCIPQCLYMTIAWSTNVTFVVFIVVLSSITAVGINSLITPTIIHLIGMDEDIGIYVGAVNSANCFGQVLNFAINASIVDTSLGYKMPIFLGGAMSVMALLTSFFFLKYKMYSM